MPPGLEINLVVPDLWQQEAVRALRDGKDVVVQAPTGSGKTFIFELLYPSLKGQAIFTVPTRALANDKLAEWRARGWDVGIATGDLALNLGAKVLVATLETQRARFLRRDGPRLLVVDEYQMIADPVRGVHYELALALAPRQTQLLLLSGSVQNPQDVVAWFQRIGRDPVLISHNERPVPLEEIDLRVLPESQFVQSRNFWPRMIGKALRADLAPVLVFAPRRNASEEMAQAIASAISLRDPLSLSAEQEALAGKRLSKLLRNRVAYHHSGLSYAVRAGLIEPLAKAGQLNVVVATMGLAAGINFSMRSVLITDTRYMAGNFERHVQPDELLQMFGRAGRRGLDEIGYVLMLPDIPRLGDARARQLKRATQVDWPSLVSVMRGAADRGEQPFAAAVELSRSLYSTQQVPIGSEHSLSTGEKPCGLWVDAERARFVRRPIVEMLNSANEWEAKPPLPQDVSLGQLLVRENDAWVRALTLPRMLDGRGFGNLCKLRDKGIYGREIPLATVVADDGIVPVKWLRKKLSSVAAVCDRRTASSSGESGGHRPPLQPLTRELFDELVVPLLPELTGGKSPGSLPAATRSTRALIFPRCKYPQSLIRAVARCSSRPSAKRSRWSAALAPNCSTILPQSSRIRPPTPGGNLVSSRKMERRLGAALFSPSSKPAKVWPSLPRSKTKRIRSTNSFSIWRTSARALVSPEKTLRSVAGLGSFASGFTVAAIIPAIWRWESPSTTAPARRKSSANWPPIPRLVTE